MKRQLASLFLVLLVASAHALPRDEQEKRAFRKQNPCPVTGTIRGACKGYHIDHKKALMNGGEDKPRNMQWLSESDHKAKTKRDMAECRASYACKNKRAAKKLPWQQAKRTNSKGK